MTIERTRELLGVEITHLSDSEVAHLNDKIKQMCRALLIIIIENHSGEKIDKALLADEPKE